jgi:hypothetical protein
LVKTARVRKRGQPSRRVVTLGCPISTDVEGVSFYQYLGLFDALGQLTNPMLPPAMAAGKYTLDAFPT